MPKQTDIAEYSTKFGKHDLDRVGLFIDMPILRPIKEKKGKKKDEKAPQLPEGPLVNMLPGGPKTKTALMDAYFDTQFKRIFRGEVLKGKRPQPPPIPIPVPFVPSGPAKTIGTPGDYYGTFSGFVKEFSPRLRPKEKPLPTRPNILTNPGKKGGPGYVNITIGKYPKHKSDRAKKGVKEVKKLELPMITGTHSRPCFELNPYKDKKVPTKRLYIQPKQEKLPHLPFIPVGPGKWMAGCKCGGFSGIPKWKKEKYLTPSQKEKILCKKARIDTKPRGTFIPPSTGYKTMFVSSILTNTNYSVNSTNWRAYQPKYVGNIINNIY